MQALYHDRQQEPGKRSNSGPMPSNLSYAVQLHSATSSEEHAANYDHFQLLVSLSEFFPQAVTRREAVIAAFFFPSLYISPDSRTVEKNDWLELPPIRSFAVTVRQFRSVSSRHLLFFY